MMPGTLFRFLCTLMKLGVYALLIPVLVPIAVFGWFASTFHGAKLFGSQAKSVHSGFGHR